MNTNLVKAVQSAIGHEPSGELTDANLPDIHRFITGTRYVEPVEKKPEDPGSDTKTVEPQKEAGFTNHGQPA